MMRMRMRMRMMILMKLAGRWLAGLDHRGCLEARAA